MPAWNEHSMQADGGMLGFRESRFSDSAVCRGALGAVPFRGTRGLSLRSRGFASENLKPPVAGAFAAGVSQPSPRHCTNSGSSSYRPFFAQAVCPQQGGGVFADITNNVSAAASRPDKAKPWKQSLPPSAVATVAEPALGAAHASEERTPADARDVDATDVQCAHEYAADFFDSLFREELRFQPRPDYMDTQTDITGKMRTILLDWLVEVHMKYRLRPETLYLAVNLIDRYLAKATVQRKRLQLVGVVAMFIAAKYEEINPPGLKDWVYITDNAYTKEDAVLMECAMLTALGFQVMVPTAAHFFEGFQKANGCDDVHREVVQYLMELALLDLQMLQYSPSDLVAAALLLSNELLGRREAWPPAMAERTRHSEEGLRTCVAELRRLLDADRAATGGQLQAVSRKFAAPQRFAVSKMRF